LEYFHARLNQGAKADHPGLAELLASWSPAISAMLNITPNHLDRHPSMKHYVRAKRALVDYQGPDGITVMPVIETKKVRGIDVTHFFVPLSNKYCSLYFFFGSALMVSASLTAS
jgi:hypothetical protein